MHRHPHNYTVLLWLFEFYELITRRINNEARYGIASISEFDSSRLCPVFPMFVAGVRGVHGVLQALSLSLARISNVSHPRTKTPSLGASLITPRQFPA